MHGAIRVIAAGAGAIVVAGAAVACLPPVIWPDAPVPVSLQASLGGARHQVWTNAIDGLRVPLHLTVLGAWCGSTGAVAIVFEEHRPPYVERRFAYAARGSMPTSADDAWSGGSGVADPVLADDELVHLLGTNPAPCD